MSGELTLLGFVAELAHLGAEIVHHQGEALEEALVLVEREAKASLGHYQEAAGPFAAWEELAPSTQAERARLGFPENEPEHRTGEMGDSIGHTILPGGREGEVGSDSEVLEWQELGTVNMPPRSILGGAAVRKEHEIVELVGGRVRTALIGAQVFQGRLGMRR